MTQAPPPERLGAGEPEILLAVVTYNSRDVIADFLRSLRAALDGAPRCRVVIVDNDSTDGTPDVVRAVAPWVTVIDAGANVGYAAGINIALRAHPPTAGAYVLNPDAVPAPGSVKVLVEAAEADPSIGIAVPRIVDSDGTPYPSLRREPTITRALAESLLGGARAGRLRIGEIVSDPGSYTNGHRADWATGAAMYLPTRTLERVGLWDERFFLYSEETDYALRVRDAGLALQYTPLAEVRHLGGDLGTSDVLWSLMTLNRVRLYRKRHGRVRSAAFWAAVGLGELVRAAAGKHRSRAALRALVSGRAGPLEPGGAAS